jgi:ectoine hydroxylase-related dioxygenase (phytanoyl-CoA dioxygenase family)
MIRALVECYLGRGAVLRDCLLQTVMPDERNTKRGVGADLSFHRDTLWQQESIYPTYLHVFVLLDDFTRRNGATVVVPGSHRQREPGYYFKLTDPRESQSGIDYRVYERRYFPSAVQLEAPRGSIVLLDPMAIHTQGNNVTPKRRSLLNMTFRAANVVGTPPLLNARAIAERFARVPVRQEVLDLLESNPSLPAHFGPLGNEWPKENQTRGDA